MAITAPKRPEYAFDGLDLPLPAWASRRPAWVAHVPEWAWVGAFMVVLCGFSLYIRTRALSGQYWMDEAITVGIASHPLTAIPGVLRMDGSPPLFYMLLHVWMSWFGNGEMATHSLTVLIGMLTVPVGLWAGWSLFGRRAGLMAAVLFATNSFITIYGQETRMYVLMALLGLLATAGFLHAFVYRRRRYVVLFSVSQALMLYTHAWSLFFGAASLLALAVLYRTGSEQTREHLIRDGLLAYVGAGALFLPWLPTFLFQTTHTAAPWDTAPNFGAPIQLSRNVLGGDRITVALVTGTVIGLSGLVTGRGRGTRDARAMWAMVIVVTVTLALAWIASRITPAWVPRYFAPIVPGILLLGAMGLARAGLIGLVCVVISVAFLLAPDVYAPMLKSNMQDVGGEMAPHLHRGDLVIVGQPEQTPLAYYYLPAGLRFTNTSESRVLKDPTFMNWINALTRLRHTNPQTAIPKLLATVQPGQQVLYIRPMTLGAANWGAPWTLLVRRRAAQWGAILGSDKQLVPEAWAPHNFVGACCVADLAILYKKVS